jgi:putative endopeptidase
VDQYQKCVFFGENLNGELTQGENIADIGGLKMAYKAYGNACKALNKHGSDPDYCEFFKSWANVWRTMITEEAAKLRIQTDPHSPGVFRVNQVLKNIPEFRDAFDVKKDDGMYLEEPAIVW